MVKRFCALAALVAAVISVGSARTANAAFPGANGKLAFVHAGDIWVAGSDGSNPTQLTTDPAFDRSPRWSPDGTRIAFASRRDGDFEIFVMNADGSGQRQVTFNAGEEDRIPAWSADAMQIVYDKNFAAIYAINADGSGGELKLADGNTPGTSAHDDVVFGSNGLVTMRLDGSARRQVTDHPGDFSANWSPSGRDIVYTRSTDTGREVYIVHANGTEPKPLTSTSDRSEFAPVWSPDGTRIAFVGCPGLSNGPDCQIYVIDGEGAGETQVTTFGVSGGEGAVDWQPLPNGPPQDIVAGSGKTTFADFPNPGEATTEQFIVTAHSGPGGEDPQGQIIFRSPLVAGGEAKADVICMKVNGNRAQVGGIFDEPVIYAGVAMKWFELIVEDNGPPGQGIDKMNAFIFFDRPRPPGFSPCNFDATTDFPIEQGNYTVKDAVSTT